MTMRWNVINPKVFFVLAVAVLVFITGQIWHTPNVADETGYPINDCGRNYFLKFEWKLPNGVNCEHTRGGVSKNFVEEIANGFEHKADIFTDGIDWALNYIEDNFFH